MAIREDRGASAYRSLRSITCDRLRQDIISGVFPPGERLKEHDLCRRYSVSATPVKQALQRLELEGLVASSPLRGSWVSEDIKSTLAETGLLRAALEGVAAYLAASKVEDDAVAALRAQVEEMAEATAAGDMEHVSEANTVFHEMIHQASQNLFLYQMTVVVHSVDLAMRKRLLSLDEEEAARGLRDHAAIFDAIAARDAERSEKLMRAHVLRSWRMPANRPGGGSADGPQHSEANGATKRQSPGFLEDDHEPR